jgi:ubiquinone/menaquinone biosynthesis C-methylase UbiE
MTKDNSFAGRKIGDEYDLWDLVIPHHGEFQQTVADAIGKYCPQVRKDWKVNVIEIGTGTGITTELILKANRRVRVFGVDKAQNMLKQAEERLARYLENGRLKLYRMEANEFFAQHGLTDVIDVVASAYTIHNLPDKEKRKLLRNVYKALKPNGILVEADVISQDNIATHERELANRIRRLDIFDKMGKPEIKQEWVEHHRYDDQEGIRMTEAELRGMLYEAGFRDVQRTYRKQLEATFVARK